MIFRHKATFILLILVILTNTVLCEELTTPTEGVDQFTVIRDTLLLGPNEENRLNAATVLLQSDESRAREILLDVLTGANNTAAKAAICRTIRKNQIKKKEDFIKPLMELLANEQAETAKLAAEATLIFKYSQLKSKLEDLASTKSPSKNARLNAIFALKLQPDKKAIFYLIDLLDDDAAEISAAAEQALRSIGIPISPETRRQIVNELKSKSKEEFMRDWLIRQEERIRRLKDENQSWRTRYFSALDKIYDGLADDAAKETFLAEYLVDAKTEVKLWSIEKVRQWRMSPGRDVPKEIWPMLVNMISDSDSNIRLTSAKTIALQGDVECADALLKQLAVEADGTVKLELFAALGARSNFSVDQRNQSLKWAGEYLRDIDAKKAQKGAQVLKKLLEQNQLEAEIVAGYLEMLRDRFVQPDSQSNESLRAELLGVMAELCGRSAHKTQASLLFNKLFEDSLADKADAVREAAANGLINVDESAALKLFKEKGLTNDTSDAVQTLAIELTGRVGSKDDLAWLAQKISSNPHEAIVWQSMLEIFDRVEADVLMRWAGQLEAGQAAVLNDEQKISLLEIAAKKTTGDDNVVVSEKLAQAYAITNKFEEAAKYFGVVFNGSQGQQKNQARINLLDVYLKSAKLDLAKQIIANLLLEKDLADDDAVIIKLDEYFAGESIAITDKQKLLDQLKQIALTAEMPLWQQNLSRWEELLNPLPAPGPAPAVKEPNEPNQPKS